MSAGSRRGWRALLSLPNTFFFWAVWVFGNLFLKIYFRLSSESRPQLEAPYILAANHSSLLDGVVLQGVMTRRICFFLTVVFFRLRVLRWFFRALRVIPIYEWGGNKNALAEAAERLREGEIIGIFPEGGISPDGKIQPVKPGVAILAESAQVLVIPVVIEGAFEAMPRGAWFPKPKRIRIRFGEPIPPPPHTEGPRRDRYREYSSQVMAAIVALKNSPL